MIKFLDKENNILLDFSKENFYTIYFEDALNFRTYLQRIYNQIQNYGDFFIISEDNKEIDLKKNIEFITDYFGIDLNNRSVISKITTQLKEISNFDHLETNELISFLDNFMDNLFFKSEYMIKRKNNIGIEDLVKLYGVVIDESDSIDEKLIVYMDMITGLLKKKMFITVNLSKFFSDEELNEITYNFQISGFNVLNIEFKDSDFIRHNICENIFIIDKDLCII